MNWIRYEEGFKSLHMTMGVALIFMLIAIIYLQVVLAACFAAVLVMSSLQNWYYKNIGEELVLVPPKDQLRLLIGASSDLKLTFKNGRIPIWNGTLSLSIEDSVAPTNETADQFSGIFDFNIPFSIGSNEEIEVTIPLEGRKRGLSRITRVVIEAPHIFGDGSVMMELKDIIRQENLVYPEIKPLERALTPSPFNHGEVSARTSLFYDALQPVGTRDYVPSDRFDQIHWTASARMQKLQTKEYMPVTERSITFVVNAIEKQRVIGDFEQKIERLASYVDYCTRNQIPYEIFLNIKTFGREPFLHQSLGSGKIQYQKSLEMLARLSEKNAKISFENILQKIETNNALSPTTVLITHDPEKYSSYAKKWSAYSEVIVDSTYDERREAG